MKCGICKTVDPAEFGKNPHVCSKCNNERAKEYYRKNKTEIAQKKSDYRKDNREKYYFRSLKHRYNVNKEWFYDQLDKQNGRCICGFEFVLFTEDAKLSPHVDHDHKTNRVRGLLCNQCNTALGMLRENPLYFKKLMKYLEEYVGTT